MHEPFRPFFQQTCTVGKKDHITFEEDEKDEAVVKPKAKKVYKTFEEFPSKLLRHDDGTTAKYKGGKQVPGSHDAPKTKQVAKKDVSSEQSRFYNPTPVSTIVETQRQGDKETAGEKETVPPSASVSTQQPRSEALRCPMKLRAVFNDLMKQHHRQGVLLGQTTATCHEEYFGSRPDR